MALQPAPVQVTWIGYPNTTGVDCIQYRFTDANADPEGTQQRFTEELVRLPHSFLCYTPPPEVGAVAPPPSEALSYVTFGSFNNVAKVRAGGVLRVCDHSCSDVVDICRRRNVFVFLFFPLSVAPEIRNRRL
jgi:predicted O-linked N-acetylglucosamine transferase (SPINDLY family)